MIDTIATVESNLEIAPGYKLLTLNFRQPIQARSGQFVMLKASDAFEPLLRRALAIYRVESATRLSFLYQVLGRGTQALSILEKGGRVDALIPLGNSWADFYAAGEAATKRAIVVAGGIGSASVLMLCQELQRADIDTHIFFGAGSKAVASGCGLEDFHALGLPLTVSTDDGSLGERGFVTAPLERFLKEGGHEKAQIYTCGPWVMMKRVAEIAEQFRTPCFASLEAPMGCGFGVCVGCVVAMREADPKSYGAYKRVCTDGSIFPAEVIEWEVAAMTH
jgi:dihydroorotate dehydrogenase electron transfer subunit